MHRLNFGYCPLGLSAGQISHISGGGSLLQDVTSARSLYYYLLIMCVALFFHKPVMRVPGIGPIRRPKGQKSGHAMCFRGDYDRRRDSESRMELQRLGLQYRPIHVTADAVLSMPPVDKIRFYLLKKTRHRRVTFHISGIAIRNWQHMTHYKEEIVKAADELVRILGARIIFIPMQYPADAEAASDVAALMKEPATVLKESYNTVEFMALMGCMDVVIANRLHALIFASIMQVPVVAISYDPKIDGFISLIGETLCGTMETVTAKALTEDVTARLKAGGIQPEVRARLNHLRRQSLRNAYLALRVIEEHTAARKG